jgi:hypothetical protein
MLGAEGGGQREGLELGIYAMAAHDLFDALGGSAEVSDCCTPTPFTA